MEPYFLDAYNSKAWILATSSDKRYRNGQQAVKLAEKSVKMDETVDSMDTMSAAVTAETPENATAVKKPRPPALRPQIPAGNLGPLPSRWV